MNANAKGLTLSILDQSPVHQNETAAQAFQQTIELAKKADGWSYHRYWVAEHHGSDRVMGSSPEVLISHLLAKTSRIRVGSGGVMLQHYSPYKVAENFNVLSSLAPGRVDLGIGRGPGGLPLSTLALQQAVAGERSIGDKIRDLRKFLDDGMEDSHPLHGLQANPKPPVSPDLYLLGTSASSAEMAAEFGLPYVFALFLNADEAEMAKAMKNYHGGYNSGGMGQKRAMLALPVVAAESDDEAAELAAKIKVVRISLESGRTLTAGNLEAAENFGKQSGEKYEVNVYDAPVVHGSPGLALKKLVDIQQLHDVEEIIAVTNIGDFKKRLRSYELLSQALVAAGGGGE
ncbi:MAG: alkane 1-monooxygenase [Chloroflexi bacterium]|nr:alkane 1-monooxygenase [Chloroflexota bacterium]MQF96204.1 LLM class flavin-dependent oxidoreductase [SAR202 cluster bacterium]|tara:strand:- start:11939 stop:12973 length:1035 start_codon:yes stop_codon:yes gene_type:complete